MSEAPFRQPAGLDEIRHLLDPETTRAWLDLLDEAARARTNEAAKDALKAGIRRQREAFDEVRREEEEADLSGALRADAEVFRDLRLKPRISEAHDFTPKVRVPVVQGLFFTDSLTWVAGASGTFKSFVTADLAFRYGQEDMDYHGRRMTKGRALLIIAEGASGYADRKTAWEKEHQREVKNVSIYPAPLQLADTLKEMPALISYLKEEDEAGRPFTLIVFDTQAMCTVGVDENTSEMNKVVNVLHRIREVSGACVMVVHHFGKDKRAGMRGSSMIYAAADTVCVLKRKDDETEVTLSTAQSDEGKQKDAITEKDLLTLEMKAHPVSEDYFGDTVFSLVPVEAAAPSVSLSEDPDTSDLELPWLTEPQMDHLRLVAFYEHRGATPADMAAKMGEDNGAPVKNGRQLIRNRMIELAKTRPALVEQIGAKGPWRITPMGTAVLARQLAVGERWVERAGRKRQVSGQVSEGQRNLLDETSET